MNVHNAFARWSRLRTWPRPLGDIALKVRTHHERYTSGAAYPRVVMLRVGTDPADALVTVLHELAHLAAHRMRSRSWHLHGGLWWSLYEASVVEVTGLTPLPPNKRSYVALDKAAAECIRHKVLRRAA